MNTYGTGDDITVEFTLLKNGQPLSGGIAGAVVKAALSKPDRSGYATGTSDATATIVDATACTCSATWVRATTGSITPGRYLVDVQVDKDGQVRTYIGGVIEIINGARPS